MEKIYMEESRKQQKKSVMNFSVVLSFVVAIFAMFSLAMFGIVSNQGTGVSYAAYTGDNFTLKIGDEYTAKATVDGTTYMYYFHSYYANSTDKANRVFCIERPIDVNPNGAYTKTTDARTANSVVRNIDGESKTLTSTADISEDYGLIYLLSIGSSEDKLASLSNYDTSDLPTGMTQGDLGAFILQSAIWYYMDAHYGSTNEAYKFYKKTDIANNIDDKLVLDSSNIKLKFNDGVETNFIGLSAKIKSLVDQANTKTIPTVSVNVGEENMSKTEDEKYYQSAKVTVVGSPSGTFETYDVTLSGIDGMIIVDEEGKEISKENIQSGTNFYVRVPADKVTKESQTVKIDVKAKFTGASAYYYKSNDANEVDKFQRMAYVAPGYKTAGAELVVVGDTGMNTAQTIYFIGLIVLLCGVGIVYANAKPVEQKQ